MRDCTAPTKLRRSPTSVPTKSVACRAPRTKRSAPVIVPPGLLTAASARLPTLPGVCPGVSRTPNCREPNICARAAGAPGPVASSSRSSVDSATVRIMARLVGQWQGRGDRTASGQVARVPGRRRQLLSAIDVSPSGYQLPSPAPPAKWPENVVNRQGLPDGGTAESPNGAIVHSRGREPLGIRNRCSHVALKDQTRLSQCSLRRLPGARTVGGTSRSWAEGRPPCHSRCCGS